MLVLLVLCCLEMGKLAVVYGWAFVLEDEGVSIVDVLGGNFDESVSERSAHSDVIKESDRFCHPKRIISQYLVLFQQLCFRLRQAGLEPVSRPQDYMMRVERAGNSVD